MTNAHVATGEPSRYERVKSLLARAAGSSSSDFGGAERFWELPLSEFLQAKIFDMRLIAPESRSSCCANTVSRSMHSGLVQALRGSAPFDGSRFPPFMWGGKRLAADDIDFIASWIDDGCPADDAGTIALDIATREVARVDLTEPQFEVAVPGQRQYAYREGEPRQRANLDCLSEAQLDELRQAFRNTYDLNKHDEDRRSYNNQALIHQNHCQHGWERFLPWHRAYLYEFEQNLQDFATDITVPYWDWTLPQYKPEKPTTGWIIPQSFKAFLRESQLDELFSALKPNESQRAAFRKLVEPRRYFVSQHEFFCCVIDEIGYTEVTPDPANPHRQALIDALMASNALWYPLRYPAEYEHGQTINQRIHYHYPTARDMQQIGSLNNFRDFGGGNVYNASFGYLDQNPHNTMHIWTGGQNPDYDAHHGFKRAYRCGKQQPTSNGMAPADELLGARRNFAVTLRNRRFHSKSDLYSQPQLGDMFSNLTASYDPVFWPVHVNVDRLWWEWQMQHPMGVPYDLDSVLSPWNYTIRDMLDISRFGYEYVRCSFFMPVGMEATISRFVSAPIRIDPKARSFKKAEIRMHWVPQLRRSCFVRAFFNEPGANAATPIQENPHYAGYLAIFGHGECYGGPGHCDLPPPRSRPFDQRSRSHNTPRNHRLDVTEALQRTLQSGDEVQITLLVIGADYQEDADLLRLEGVSLNLLD